MLKSATGHFYKKLPLHKIPISQLVAKVEYFHEVLKLMEKENKLFFGLYLSEASVMSCYVRNREDEHIHFVDGSQGGYTQATKMLKKKL